MARKVRIGQAYSRFNGVPTTRTVTGPVETRKAFIDSAGYPNRGEWVVIFEDTTRKPKRERSLFQYEDAAIGWASAFVRGDV